MKNNLELVNQKTAYHSCAELATMNIEIAREEYEHSRTNKSVSPSRATKASSTALHAINTMIRLADLELKRAVIMAKFEKIKLREIESKPFDNTI